LATDRAEGRLRALQQTFNVVLIATSNSGLIRAAQTIERDGGWTHNLTHSIELKHEPAGIEGRDATGRMSREMRKLYHSHLSPYARRVLIVLLEKGLEHQREKHAFAREFAGLASINPCLLLPVFIDGDVHLWGSNLIIEYLLKTYPRIGVNSPQPPLGSAMTRSDRHWEDARVLATVETMTDSIMNLRQMKMSGVEADQVAYLRRQRDRIDLCLDWLDKNATSDGFAPGEFSIMDLNLICALGNVDNHKSFEWRGRPALEAIVARYSERPSVKATRQE
jgi:glutathione S-transferase